MATRRGFTIVELLVTLGIIGLLAGLLLPALSIVRANAAMANSTSNLRQTAVLMGNYSAANRDTVLPSLFDHSQVSMKGKARSVATNMPVGNVFMGTWADILWTDAGFGPVVIEEGTNAYDYRFDAPDGTLWERLDGFERGPLRSTLPPRKVFDGVVSADSGIDQNAYGSRTLNIVEPGMFAANNFFDARPGTIDPTSGVHSRRSRTNHLFDAVCNAASGRMASNQPMAGSTPVQYSMYFTNTQILRPDASAYLIDSMACETIDPVQGTGVSPFQADDPTLSQVAFRYPGDSCAVLLLDGHVRTEQRWETLLDVEGTANDRTDAGLLRSTASSDVKDQGRGIRFRHLDQR